MRQVLFDETLFIESFVAKTWKHMRPITSNGAMPKKGSIRLWLLSTDTLKRTTPVGINCSPAFFTCD